MAHSMKGIIAFWSGAVVDIPYGWQLCDGTGGTPDLRDQFVIGAGSTHAPDAAGGEVLHQHYCDFSVHRHYLAAGAEIGPGTYKADYTNWVGVRDDTDDADATPPYYALCCIMHT